MKLTLVITLIEKSRLSSLYRDKSKAAYHVTTWKLETFLINAQRIWGI